MAVNNFRATLIRSVNGKKYEYELAQVPNVSGQSRNDKYRYLASFPVGMPNIGSVTQEYFSSYRLAYPTYTPGEIYIPDKHFMLNDLIPRQIFSEKFINAFSLLKEDDRSVHYDFTYMNIDDYFVWDEEQDIWGVWTLLGSCGAVSYGGLNIQATIGINLFTMKTTLSMIEFSEGSPQNTPGIRLNTPDGIITSPEWNRDGYWVGTDILSLNFESGQKNTKAEVLNDFNLIVNKYYESKLYYAYSPISNRGYNDNTGNYFYTEGGMSNNASALYKLYLLIDFKADEHYLDNGFTTNSIYFLVERYYPELVKIVWGSGPNNNHPGHKEDDPNDNDPGIGPGGNKDDEGGDGDYNNTSDKIIKPNLPTLSASQAGLITIFNPSLSELSEISAKLWSPDAWNAIKQYFTTPLDAVLGLGIIPVAPLVSGKSNVFFGLYDTEVSANVVTSDYVIVDCGSIPITRYYGSYLDYSPYTNIKCYLPYIGEIDINPDEAMQKTLNIQYYVNVVTGDTVAMCLLDGDLFYTATGNCIRQLPLSSADYSAIINTAVSAVSTILVASATAGVGAAAVEAASARPKVTEESKKLASAQATENNVGSSTSLLNNITGAKMRYNHAGSMGTGAGQLCRQKPYLIIERPNLDLASNYKGFVGYPCNKTKQISACQGYTQIEASNITVANATDIELSMIKEILMEGVIL